MRMEPRKKICELDSCHNEFESFDDRKRFCTRSCAITANNRRKGVSQKKCYCGNDIIAWSSKVFCSPECKRRKPIVMWLNGEWNGSVKEGLSSTIRNYLLDRAGYKCQDGRSGCGQWGGINPKSGRSCLTIDHTDGNVYNNSPTNLVVMCPNCHSMTETYGGLNRGNGRKYRYSPEQVLGN